MFVTVGTTHFDPLIRAVDALAGTRRVTMPVLCQIGSGTYVPQHCEHFRFRPSIDDAIAAADLVVTHGGATVLALLAARKRFVAVANTSLADNHQAKFLGHLARYVDLFWTSDVGEVGDMIQRALAAPAPQLRLPRLGDALRRELLQRCAS